MSRPISSLLLAAVAIFLSIQAIAADDGVVSSMSIPRMGAGAPEGWRVRMSGANWTTDAVAGPFGAGAARVTFDGEGRVELTSPARTLPAGQPYAAFVWARSEGAGASLELAIKDNRGDHDLAEAKLSIGSDWQPATFRIPALPADASGECYLEFNVRGKDTTVSLDGLWFGACAADEYADAKPPLPRCSVVLTSDAPWGIIAGDAPLTVMARTAGDAGADAELRLHVVSTTGASFDVPPAAFADTVISINDPAAAAFGMYRVEATVTDANGQPLSAMAETLLSRVPAPVPGPRKDSYFGAHVRLQEPDLAAAELLGYKWCRIHDASGITKWGIAEPEPGNWIWADDQVALARKHGFSILGMLDGSPKWESGIDDDGYFSIWGAPRDVGHWRNYAREMVGHYKGSIDDWEMWNEPWDMARFFRNGTPLYYAELLKAAYEEAKAVNPTCTIVGVDTYPPIWEKMVLSAGAYPYYDVLSWHRYDPNLHAWPGDALARVADRINTEQAKYGAPKPLMCSEGGPDVARFHGSFFSFADRAIVGDWSRGADQYARMYLGAIAAGNQRLFCYTMHTDPRHGQRIQALTEPGIRPKPMHLGLAALAHFVEGARYVERLRPTPDISAHVFEQPEARDFCNRPSTVVVLHADGNDDERLPFDAPGDVRAFDRWGNAIPMPLSATRGLTFLVVPQDERSVLLEWLSPGAPPVETAREQRPAAVEALVDAFLGACANGAPLWSFFSTQGSLLVLSVADGALVSDRNGLRAEHMLPTIAQKAREANGLHRTACMLQEAGPFSIGEATLTRADDSTVPLSFSVAFDGPGGAPRFLGLTLQLDAPDPAWNDTIEAKLRGWESVFKEASTESLRDAFVPDTKALLAVSTANGEYFVFDTPDYLRTMLDTAVMWGKALRSQMTFDAVHVDAQTATARGTWDLASLSLGATRNPFTATLYRERGAWRFVSLTFGAPTP